MTYKLIELETQKVIKTCKNLSTARALRSYYKKLINQTTIIKKGEEEKYDNSREK